MPRIDFNTIEEHGDLVPDGIYPCVIEKVREGRTQGGDEMWHLRLRIVEGDFAGKSVFDSFVFSQAALPRVKLACKALGIDTRKAVDLATKLLVGRRCKVAVEVHEFADKHGRTRRLSKVIYDGYEPLGAGDRGDVGS